MVLEVKNIERKDFYVYVFYNNDWKEPFYIGKGTGDRINSNDRNKQVLAILNKYDCERRIVLNNLSENDAIGSLIKGFLTYKTVTKGIDIFNFFKGQSTNQKAMQAFFQSAVNGTMQVKDGFVQIGEAEKKIFNNQKTTGFGKRVLLVS